MTIRYKCEECGAALNINDELAGTEGSCPRCHVEFIVPSADAAAAKPAAAEKPKHTGAMNTEDEIGDFLSSDEIPAVTGKTSLADPDEDEPFADDNPFEDAPPQTRKQSSDENDEVEEEDLAARSKKKAGKGDDGKAGAKRASVDSAAIAKNLMGKGKPLVAEETEPQTKKKRRQFGEGSERPKGEITSVRDMITYIAKAGWPAILAMLAVLGLSIWVYGRMQKTLDVPPLASVSGTVTIDGKPVAPGTMIQFIPVESARNTKLGSSVGVIGADGKYELMYAVGHPGAVIGKHYVIIKPSDPSQSIPERYGLTSNEMQKDVTKDGKPVDIALKSDPVPSSE